MYKIVNNLLKLLCFTFILAIVATIGIYIVLHADTEYVYDNSIGVKEYVVNKRSRKIHISNCSSVDKMSEKNKKVVNEDLGSLVAEGYIICNRCNAGLKRKNEIISIAKDLITSLAYINDEEILPTEDEYLKSIDLIGEWYVNNVPTYLTHLQTEDLTKYKNKQLYINEYLLKNKLYNKKETEEKYLVITNDEHEDDINNYSEDTKVLTATEEAVKNYQDRYKELKHHKSITLYPCEYVSESIDGYNMAGDDCVRFMFSCMNNIDKRFTNKMKKYSKKPWYRIGSIHIGEERKEVVLAMHKAGFEVYDTIGGDIDVDNDGKVEVEIKRITRDFKLQKGDILARNGHVHFYLGESYSMSEKNFGWGHVNREYPQLSQVGLSNINESYKVYCKDGNYNRVYRYVGN